MIEDPGLPAAAFLLGPGARPLVDAGIRGLGGELRTLRSTQVVYRPGRELTVRYAARVRWPGAEESVETICVGTTRDGAPAGTVPLVAGDLEVGMWRYPFDPFLPGLPDAATPSSAGALVGHLVGGVPTLEVRSYRPGRRAVIQATGPAGEVYLKLVPPAELDRLVAAHATLYPALPVPEVLATDGDHGLLVMRALPGEGLRPRLLEGRVPWPAAEDVLRLVARLAATPIPAGTRPVTPLHADVDRHLTVIERACPSDAQRVAALRRDLVDARDASDVGDAVLVHGDLHEAQLLVDGRTIVGLLDIDGVGPGHPIDDLSRLLGHLSTLALGAGSHRRALDRYTDALFARFATEVDGRELALRAAATVVGLATGPFRVQMPGWRSETRRRLALARRWIRDADGSGGPGRDEESLIPSS